ncbi:response regulator [Streptomyces sp. NPDC093228]|jgi:CheY-like chemotaxis protein|uniref:response regulator n=1 Tax=unclassified Streptomyces TaxID=2593676 RepID=UPI0007413ED7|nr:MULTISPECIES: response regulator [unclassified Streptomyces]KUJ34993.1 transcriptional regulator [Streptomyces sp. NRRL F-5122]MDX3263794.1 response regulator [Streptomyces sp. MI02-2A]
MSINPADQCSILIVDDMEENLVAFEAVLGPLHQRLVRARSGEQALKAMLRQEFAVVLLDVRMPDMDGFETAANIKRLDQTKDVPIILVTGTEAGTDYAYRGYAIGAADFITKPIDPWVLRTKISVFLDLHRKNRQLALRAVAADTDRLTDITERLTQIELLLRNRTEADTDGLADRIGELERTVGGLLPGPVETE